MMKTLSKYGKQALIVVTVLLAMFAVNAQAAIEGLNGTNFNFVARSGYLSTPDGNSILMWGYADGDAGLMQYPGPTLIVNQGDVISISLKNELPAGNPVSIIFPGQMGVAAVGGSAGQYTRESTGPTDSVTYTFTADNAGTYSYHSGTNAELQIEMGLVGTLIVRPVGYGPANLIAYGHEGARYDYEYLFMLSELDPAIHELVEFGLMDQVDLTTYYPVIWMINGRSAPDTMLPDFTPWLPHQPYRTFPRMNPGGKLLLRIVGAGRDLHPFHHHGNNSDIIARDGRLLESMAGVGPDISQSVFTVQSVPGQTVDAIFGWTGKGLGFDIYGTAAELAHDCIDLVSNEDGSAGSDDFDDTTYEYCPDHGKGFPVDLPENQELAFGGFWSGSPFMGAEGALPPGEGGLNANGGYFYMWHSHAEKEMANFDVFPGGMMTMMVVEPPHVVIP